MDSSSAVNSTNDESISSNSKKHAGKDDEYFKSHKNILNFITSINYLLDINTNMHFTNLENKIKNTDYKNDFSQLYCKNYIRISKEYMNSENYIFDNQISKNKLNN